MSQHSALPEGFHLGPYVILRFLESGAFGITYLAQKKETGETVVIKENFPTQILTRASGQVKAETINNSRQNSKLTIEWAQNNFTNEGKLLREFNHPNLVRFLDGFYAPSTNTHFYVMDYLSGGSLASYYRSNTPLEKMEVFCIAKAVLSGLAHVHNKQILHRDLKPDNILISKEGIPTIIDFGTARATSKEQMTQLCTLDFAAIEQIYEDPDEPELQLGKWTDIFALGVCLYLGINDSLPPNSQARKLSSKDKYIPLMRNSNLQQRYGKVLLSSIDKALSLYASRRFLNAEEWLNYLRQDPDFAITPKSIHDAHVQPELHAIETTRLIPTTTKEEKQRESLPRKPKVKSNTHLTIALPLALICLLAAFCYYIFSSKQEENKSTLVNPLPSHDSGSASELAMNFNDRATNASSMAGNRLDNTANNTANNKLDNTLDNRADNTLDNTLDNTPDTRLDNTLDNTSNNKLGNTLDNTLDNRADNKLGNTLDNRANNKLDAKLSKELSLSFAPKVLTAPQALLYSASGVALNSMPLATYTVLYKLKQGEEYTEVGKTPDESIGYLKNSECVTWDNNIVVRFNHPGISPRRNRALFFKSKEAAEHYATMDESEREQLESKVLTGKADADSGVIAIEPENWANKGNFYLLPLTDFAKCDEGQLNEYELGYRSAGLLEVQAVTESAPQPQKQASNSVPRVDIVFVMDLSMSMGVYVNDINDGIQKISQEIEGKLKGHVRFGLWGYRDWGYIEDGSINSDLCDYVTHNYTPNLLPAEEFANVLSTEVRETKKNSEDFAEDVISGVHDAIYKTNWRNPSNDDEQGEVIRIIVLVGDAGMREIGDREGNELYPSAKKATGNLVQSNISEIIAAMNAPDKHIYLQSFFLSTPKPRIARISQQTWDAYQKLSEQQFKMISMRNGEANSMVIKQERLNGKLQNNFTQKASAYINELIESIAATAESKLNPAKIMHHDSSSSSTEQKQARRLFANAYVEWVSGQKQEHVNTEMRGWVFDTSSDGRVSLERCVLLTEHTLEQLAAKLSHVVSTFERGSSQNLVLDIQKASANNVGGQTALRDNVAISLTELKNNELMELLSKLPYKSAVMSFEAITAPPQDFVRLKADLESKIQYYRMLNANRDKPGLWFKMEDGSSIIPVPMKQLP